MTHALAIDPDSGLIYVSSGNGVEIFNPADTDAADGGSTRAWQHFSNTEVGDLAFGPDGRLWGVRWTGGDITAADASQRVFSLPTAAGEMAELPPARVGEPWTATLQARDSDGSQFYWQILQGPPGLTLTPDSTVSSNAEGYTSSATLAWTPGVRDLADTEILVRLVESRGGVALRRFSIAVAGGNHAPVIDSLENIVLGEGEALSLPIIASDAEGDPLTLTVRNLPAGARFDARTGRIEWTPSYDQAGDYPEVTVVASDGKATTIQRFNLRVTQGYAQPVLSPIPAQTLREGERFALQQAGRMPGATEHAALQADGTRIVLSYSAPWLPGGATLNPDTGWFEWTPGFDQHDAFSIPITLTATYYPAGLDAADDSADSDALVRTSMSCQIAA